MNGNLLEKELSTRSKKLIFFYSKKRHFSPEKNDVFELCLLLFCNKKRR